MCHQMSGSAICFTENPKITAASRNMHITGKEKMLAAKLVQEVLAAGWALSDDGEYDVIGKPVSSPISFRFNSPGLSTVSQPPRSLAYVRIAQQLCQNKSYAMRESVQEDRTAAVSAVRRHSQFCTCPGWRRALLRSEERRVGKECR